MKIDVYIFFALLLCSFVKTEKEIPAKIYYKNESYMRLWSFGIDDPYPDTAVYLHNFANLFEFKGQLKTITIYFDLQLTLPAVSMTLDKADKTLHYRRFDRKGTLRMEYVEKNGEYQHTLTSWYSNRNVKSTSWYENGKQVCDTNYYLTGELRKVELYYNSRTFKEQSFYKNGSIKSEWFWRVPDLNSTYDNSIHAPKFKIEYDSINGFPNLYYLKDSDHVEITPEGYEIGIRTSKKLSVDSVLFRKK